jgi:hypothetical protein
VGSQQHWALGEKLCAKYIAEDRLLDPQAPDLVCYVLILNRRQSKIGSEAKRIQILNVA